MNDELKKYFTGAMSATEKAEFSDYSGLKRNF